jgi:hypothetical protein
VETGFPVFSVFPDTVGIALCAIKYFLACNNSSGDIYNGRVRGDGKQRS